MKECDNCLFFVDPMSDTIICIRGKRIKELNNKKTNCKNWVEGTPENAEKEFKSINKNGEGNISFEEFCSFAINKSLELEEDDGFDDVELKNLK